MSKTRDLTERMTQSKELFSGKMLHAYIDTIELPNGNPATREYVKHLGAVAVVPVTEDGKVIMEKQYRYPVSRIVTEIPAGKLDSAQEDRLSAAQRELREETGITADEWISLGEYHPAPAYSNEVIWIFLARGLHQGDQDLDEDEFLEVEEVPLTDLVNQVFAGEIRDGKTQVALLKAARVLGIINM